MRMLPLCLLVLAVSSGAFAEEGSKEPQDAANSGVPAADSAIAAAALRASLDPRRIEGKENPRFFVDKLVRGDPLTEADQRILDGMCAKDRLSREDLVAKLRLAWQDSEYDVGRQPETVSAAHTSRKYGLIGAIGGGGCALFLITTGLLIWRRGLPWR